MFRFIQASKEKADSYDRKLFSQIVSDFSQIKKVPYRQNKIKVKSVLGNESIDIESSEIGQPLLIKVSYHPNWRIEGAERVYLVSPSFMLVFPTKHKLHLSFDPGNTARIGWGLTLGGIFLAGLSLFWPKQRKDRQ